MFVLTCVLEFVFVILTLYVPIVGAYYSRISNGSSKFDKFEKTFYDSLSDCGTAYTVVGWIVAAVILVCLIVYLCNKHSVLLNKILRFVLLAMTPILPIMFFVALGQASDFEMTSHGSGFVTGEGYRSTTNFWGVFFVIAFVVLSGYIVFQCKTNPDPKFVRINKENRENENSFSNPGTAVKKFESDLDADSYFTSKIGVITGEIIEKFDAANEEYKSFLDKIEKITHNLGDTIKILTELHDEDFDELNEIYGKYNKYQVANEELLNSKRYLTLKENCIRKNLPNIVSYCANIEEVCRLYIEASPYKRQVDEWRDVMNLKAREKWSLPEQKELFDKLYAVKNDERYLALQKKLSEWAPYSSGLLLFDDSSKSYEIGRKGNEVALKDQKNYEIKKLSVDDIIFVQINETTSPFYRKPSKMGIAMNEMLWGTAAATASAMQKNQSGSTCREAVIYFRYDLNIGPLHTAIDSADKLLAMFPEKIK